MAEPRKVSSSSSSSSISCSGEFADERAKEKEENDEAKRNLHHHHHHKETHGLRDDIDEETSINDVKAPNVFERTKEEIEAIVEAIHPKKESKIETHDDHHGKHRDSARKEELKPESPDSHSEKNSKSPNIFERAKEDIEALTHKKKQQISHDKEETHGTSNDIDENTPIDEVKAPSVFQRVKEEMEAIIGAIHPKKDSGDDILPPKKKEGGFRSLLEED